MEELRRTDWLGKLRPLDLDGEAIETQMRRRLGVVVVASVLFGGVGLFFLAIFAGFGRWEIGLVLDGLIAPVVGWIWLGYFRLRRNLARYRREMAIDRAG